MPTPLIIMITSCVMALAMSVVLLIIAKTYPKNIRGLKEWGLAVLVTALSLPFFIARDIIPDLLSIVLANLMLLVGFMLMNHGTRKFAGTKSTFSRTLLFLFVLSYVALFAWFTYVQPHVGMRVATLSLFTLLVILNHLILVLRELPRTAGRSILVFSLAVLITSRVARLSGLILGYDQPTGVFDASTANIFFIALPSIMLPLGTISFVMLASERLRKDLEFSSRHDGLTQCLNKKAAIEELDREIARAKRYRNKLSIMLIDLDNFGDINNTHGHLEGDKVLVDFSKRTRASLRETDQLTRFGGDEFMAILPYTDRGHAELVANRLHEAGKEGQPLAWSVSIGVSEWQDQDDSLKYLLTRADQALYKSKGLGRSQTQAI
ncbi:MAG TPA: GGDEF domain-containing protein [Thiobacillus sp.]|nr:GGDEF domain-containing protein [Thiobacillus sp.]